MALLLACGMYDGLVPGDPPHVVKGSCVKVMQPDAVETVREGDEIKRVSRRRESMKLIIRAVYPDGTIVTYE